MKNKKGWLRIVEAFIAVTLITIVMLTIYSVPVKKNNDAMEKLIDAILDEIANNNQLRQDVLNEATVNLEQFVAERIPKVMNFTIKICEIEDVCSLQEYKPEVYARERIISSTLQEYNPKKIKIFAWECSGANCQPEIMPVPATPACSDSDYDWQNVGCGNGCGNEMNQTGIYTGALQGCNDKSRCVPDSSCQTASSCQEIANCGTELDESGCYSLTQSLYNSEGSCINIIADNIILDGNSFAINSYGSGFGIYADSRNNITIKNFLNISGFDHGISLSSTSSSTIENITANSNNFGIYLDSSPDNTLQDITANNNSNSGIYLESSSGNNLNSITANSNNFGIYLDSSPDNTLQDITANSNNNYGIYLYSSSGNNLNSITANSNNGGIYIYFSDSNILTRIIANNNHDYNYGIYLYSSSGNNLNSITANSNYYGIYLDSSPDNTLQDITANSNRYYGIYLFSGLNNQISNSKFCYNVNRKDVYCDAPLSNSFDSISCNQMKVSEECSLTCLPC